MFARTKREKLFGLGRPRPLDREAKCRLMHLARCLSRRVAKGKHYGAITAKALDVLEALLWGFHNARSGVCFPSLASIAEQAGCARSTVAEALKALELAGLLSWCNRLIRVRWHDGEALAWRWRVLRTSNGYTFADPASKASGQPAAQDGRWGIRRHHSRALKSSKSESQSGTPNQAFIPELAVALSRLQEGLRNGAARPTARKDQPLGSTAPSLREV